MSKVRNISCFHNVYFSQLILLLNSVKFSQLFVSASITYGRIVKILKSIQYKIAHNKENF